MTGIIVYRLNEIYIDIYLSSYPLVSCANATNRAFDTNTSNFFSVGIVCVSNLLSFASKIHIIRVSSEFSNLDFTWDKYKHVYLSFLLRMNFVVYLDISSILLYTIQFYITYGYIKKEETFCGESSI